ncbi:type III-A CRISPR-associated RAMP protein Csm4 [Methanocaldococcus sp. 28A]
MNRLIVKLIPGENDKYHFGEGYLTDSNIIFHSHSLFSAIINNFIKIYGEEELIKIIDDIKNIKLSSLLPAIYKVVNGEIEDFIYFLPKPATFLGFDKEEQKKVDKKPKDIKKVQFISVNALKSHNKKELKKLILGKKFLVEKNEYEEIKNYGNPKNINLFESFIEQKVAIDRIKQITLEEGKGQLYSVGYIKPLVSIENNNGIISGFYFLLEFDKNNKSINKIKSAIKLIEDEGLGGERSTGAGLFKKIIIGELPKNFEELFKNKDKIETNMAISITIPKNEHEFEKIVSYQLMKIGGYVYSPYTLTKAKKYIYAIKEGAIIRGEIEGKTENLSPKNYKHEVLVNGKPILIPTKYYDNGG